MTLYFGPAPAPALASEGVLTRILAFLGGGLVGFVLMGVLSLRVWPEVLPYSRFLVSGGAGLAAAMFVAIACGIAGLIACYARSSSLADD